MRKKIRIVIKLVCLFIILQQVHYLYFDIFLNKAPAKGASALESFSVLLVYFFAIAYVIFAIKLSKISETTRKIFVIYQGVILASKVLPALFIAIHWGKNVVPSPLQVLGLPYENVGLFNHGLYIPIPLGGLLNLFYLCFFILPIVKKEFRRNLPNGNLQKE